MKGAKDVAIRPYDLPRGSCSDRCRSHGRCDVVLWGIAGVRSTHARAATPAAGLHGGRPGQGSAGVASATADYLFSHPDVNAFFTSLHGLPQEEIRGDIQNYMNGNPQVHSELTGIRQPLTDLRARCEPVA